jgi:hypothetical protein
MLVDNKFIFVSLPRSASTSFYISNTAMYCSNNYQVTVPDRASGNPVPLAVTYLYSNDTSSATGSGPIYANYSVQSE